MQKDEHHFRLDIAKALDSQDARFDRGANPAGSREVIHDGRFHQLMVNDEGELSLADPPPRKVAGKILLALGGFAALGVGVLVLVDYINLKTTKPAPLVLTAPILPPDPTFLPPQSSAPSLISLPPVYQASLPLLAPEPTIIVPKTDTVAEPVPADGVRRISLTHGSGEVKEDDGSTKFLIKPNGE